MPRRPLLLTAVFAVAIALATVGVAVAQKPVVVRAGNLVLTLNGGVKPKALPRRQLAPISLDVSGRVATTDGSQPPAAGTVTIDFDRNGTVNARGLPVCTAGRLQSRPTGAARRACPQAIVGRGRTQVRVAFPEQPPFSASGPLVLFNGGVRGGTTTMLIHAYVSVPAPTAIVAVVRIRQVRKGRFGTRAVATIPLIAGGSGSVTSFNLTVNRRFNRGGRRQSYLLARCADGRFLARADVAFRAGGGRIAGTVTRACRVRR